MNQTESTRHHRPLNLRLTTHAKLDAYKAEHGLPKAETVERAVTEYVARHAPRKPRRPRPQA